MPVIITVPFELQNLKLGLVIVKDINCYKTRFCRQPCDKMVLEDGTTNPLFESLTDLINHYGGVK